MSLLVAVLALGSCRQRSQSTVEQQQAAQPRQQVQTSAETEQAQSCKKFVQDFYDWYFDRLNSQIAKKTEGPSTYDVLRLKPQVITPRLRTMLEEDVKAQSKSPDEVVGLDLDPFINAQDWEGKYWTGNVTLNGENCRVAVWGTDSGAKYEIVDPELKLENGQWVFVNFHYPGSETPRDENLIALLTGLRDDRNHAKARSAHK